MVIHAGAQRGEQDTSPRHCQLSGMFNNACANCKAAECTLTAAQTQSVAQHCNSNKAADVDRKHAQEIRPVQRASMQPSPGSPAPRSCPCVRLACSRLLSSCGSVLPRICRGQVSSGSSRVLQAGICPCSTPLALLLGLLDCPGVQDAVIALGVRERVDHSLHSGKQSVPGRALLH